MNGSVLTIQKQVENYSLELKGFNINENSILKEFQLQNLINFINSNNFTVKGLIDSLLIQRVIQSSDSVFYYIHMPSGYIHTVKVKKNSGDHDSLFYKSFDLSIGSIQCDGITVIGELNNAKINKEFRFWSPDKGTKNDEFIGLLFELMYKNLTNEASIIYLENLEEYFNFGVGLKKNSDNPLTYKLYGSLTINEKKELDEFIKELPKNKKIIFDMSNFDDFTFELYDTFKNLSETYKLINWINCSEITKKDLTKAGVDKKRIK